MKCMKIILILVLAFFITSKRKNSPEKTKSNTPQQQPSIDRVEIVFDGFRWHTFIAEYRAFEIELFEDGVCINATKPYYYFWSESVIECLYKDEENKRFFISCKTEDKSDCKFIGNIKEEKSWLSAIGLGKSVFQYDFNQGVKIMSHKHSEEHFTIIKFYVEGEKTQQIARIDIKGQGKGLKEAESVNIFRFSELIDMKRLILVAAQNIKTYSSNISKYTFFKYTKNFIRLISGAKKDL